MRVFKTANGKEFFLPEFLNDIELSFFRSKAIEDKADHYYSKISNPSFAICQDEEDRPWAFAYKSVGKKVHSDDFFSNPKNFEKKVLIVINEKNGYVDVSLYNRSYGWIENLSFNYVFSFIKSKVNLISSISSRDYKHILYI